jgi:hypothetical protein
MMRTAELILEALNHRPDAVFYAFGKSVTELFPNIFVMETEDPAFDPFAFSEAGNCEVKVKSAVYGQTVLLWETALGCGKMNPGNYWVEVEWQGRRLELVCLRTAVGKEAMRWFILADSAEQAQEFFETVCSWRSEAHGPASVFENGMWGVSEDLERLIRHASWNDLPFADSSHESLVSWARSFFDGRSDYEQHDVPWQGQVLLVGPSGSGRVPAAHALLGELKLPALWVKSLSGGQTPTEAVDLVFKNARASAPCVVVLENLEDLLNDLNRDAFLRELDRHSRNLGILFIATCSNVQDLGPAIADHPGRFGQVFEFHMPTIEERERFIERLNRDLKEPLRLTPLGVDDAVRATDGFSFLQIRQLFASAKSAWMWNRGGSGMDGLILHHATSLRRCWGLAAAPSSSSSRQWPAA